MKYLLLSDIPPCDNYTAGIFLEYLSSYFPDDWAAFIVLNPYLKPNLSDNFLKKSSKIVAKPSEGRGAGNPRFLKNLSSIYFENKYLIKDIPEIAKQVIEFCQEEKIEAIFSVLEGQIMIPLVDLLLKKVKLPHYPLVMDMPSWWLKDWQVNRITTHSVLNKFDRILENSTCIAAGSDSMADIFIQRYGVNSIGIPSPLPDKYHQKSYQKSIGNEIIITMTGQLYASIEWQNLISALQSVNWELCGKKVKVRLIGRNIHFIDSEKMNIEFFGWRTQEDVMDFLVKSDICYCPYWFNEAYREQAITSFPSKLTSYLASGTPVFFHGPDYASPSKFLKKHEAAVFCHSLSNKEIIEQLEQIVSDEKLYRHISQNASKAFITQLSSSAIKKKFVKIVTYK